MSLKDTLQEDLAVAMRAREAERRDTLRLLLAAIKQAEVDQRVTLDDAGMQAVLTRQAKQRRESIADFERAGRPDLAAKEERELEIIKGYLPESMSRAEIEIRAQEVIAEKGATEMKDFGRVMGALMPQLKGRADGQVVSSVVRRLLQE